ncbi:MAG: hypothetical protein MPJ50_03415 [Pirellulales bacterium]|nr:hypothetical protein [Pirellulales bacterium]
MEARTAQLAYALVVTLTLTSICTAANYRTANFVVEAASPQVARLVAESAEKYRRDLAIEWLGEAMPDWSRPCPIRVEVGPRLGAGGATSFMFARGEVFDWKMEIQGPMDRLLDSVLPHEVTHTIFATHFRQPLPRWADEGACTTVEHTSERNKQQRMLIQFLQTGRGISFSQMFRMKEYPNDVLPLYAQGHSLATYLIDQGGKSRYLQFLGDGLESEDWLAALRKHYNFQSMQNLQDTWLDWVIAGSPMTGNRRADIAAAPQPDSVDDITYRGQDPGVRLATASREVPGYARGESGSPDERSSNRTRQAPPPAADWRASGAPRREVTPPRPSKLSAPQKDLRKPSAESPPAGSSSSQSTASAGETRLLLEWSRSRTSEKDTRRSNDAQVPTRRILRSP